MDQMTKDIDDIEVYGILFAPIAKKVAYTVVSGHSQWSSIGL